MRVVPCASSASGGGGVSVWNVIRGWPGGRINGQETISGEQVVSGGTAIK